MTRQIAIQIEALSGSSDVAVYLQGEHLCMVMRGIKTPGLMQTSVMNGAFRHDANLRAEFLSLVK
jgi:GTP cyclohydrolase I